MLCHHHEFIEHDKDKLLVVITIGRLEVEGGFTRHNAVGNQLVTGTKCLVDVVHEFSNLQVGVIAVPYINQQVRALLKPRL